MVGNSFRRVTAAAVVAATLLSPALWARTGSAPARSGAVSSGVAATTAAAASSGAALSVGWLDALRNWARRLFIGPGTGAVPASGAATAPQPPVDTTCDKGAAIDPWGTCVAPPSGG